MCLPEHLLHPASDPVLSLFPAASSSSDLSVKLWDFTNQSDIKCIRTLVGHDHSVTGVLFLGPSPVMTSPLLASCSRDNSIKFWELESGYCVKTLVGHGDWVRKLAVNADATLLASCSSDQTIVLWALPNGDVHGVLRGHEHVIECVAFCNDFHDAEFDKKAKALVLAVSAVTVLMLNVLAMFGCTCTRVCVLCRAS